MPYPPLMDGQKTSAESLSVVFASDASLPSSGGSSALPAGTNYVGKVATDVVTLTLTPTLTVHANYLANDYIGTSGAAMRFINAVRENGGSAFIRAKLYSNVAQAIPMELWLFDAAITPPADSAAWSISDADNLHCVGVIQFNTWFAGALNSVSVSDTVMWVKADAASRDLWGCVVTRGAPTLADGDLTAKLICIEN